MDTVTALILAAFAAGATLYLVGNVTVPVLLAAVRERRRRRINVRHAAPPQFSGRRGAWFTGRHRDALLIGASVATLAGVARVGWWLR